MKQPTLTYSQIISYWQLVVFLVAAGVLYLLNSDGQYNDFLAILLLAINVHMCWRVRRNWYLLIIFGIIFYCNYSICVANYITNFDNFFTSLANTSIASKGLYVLLGFSLILDIFLPQKITANSLLPLTENNRYNPIISWGLLISLICIGIFAYDRPDIAGMRADPSSTYEYSYILIILGIYYSGSKKILQRLYIWTTLALALQNLIFGGRISSIQFLICLMLCFFIRKMRIAYMIPLLCIGIIILAGIGKFRAEFSLNETMLFTVYQSLKNELLTMDTAYSAYFSSLAFLVVLGMTPWIQRFYLFKQFCLYLFLGPSIPDSNLILYTQQYIKNYGGGVTPFFGYFYLGVFGVILSGIYVAWLCKKIAIPSSESSGLWRCIALQISITTFRWYLYSPAPLLRGLMFLIIAYAMCNVFHCMTTKKI